MDVIEEVIGCNDYSHIVKGKRTKRQRLLLPVSAAGVSVTAMTSSSSTGDDDRSLPSPATSVEFSGSTNEEDEDMANCLILLAQGPERDCTKFRSRAEEVAGERISSRRFAEAATTTNGKAGFYVYECKTCNRCFPSFQALGGHRASHKKPKAMEEKRMVVYEENKISTTTPSILLHVGNKPLSYNNTKSKIHECSICGSEFSSGQALGGHMRRHRSTVPESNETKKEKNILPLDLNLPAPEDDRDYSEPQGTFSFSRPQPLSFVASPLVDCHY